MAIQKILQQLATKYAWLNPQSMHARRGVSAAVAILLALIADSFFSRLHQVWIPLITAMLIFSNPKMDLQKIFMNFIVISCWICLAFIVEKLNLDPLAMMAVMGCMLIIGYIMELLQVSSAMLVIPAMLYLLWLHFWPPITLMDLLRDAALATVIVAFVTAFVFPKRADEDFRRGLIPVFEAYRVYLKSIIQYLSDKKAYEHISLEKKLQVMKTLQEDESFFPEWVYHVGLSSFYRKGHRHFIVRTEQMGAVLFALHQMVRYDFSKKVLSAFQTELQAAIESVDKLFESIIARLDLKATKVSSAKLKNKIADLDHALEKIAPASVELIDVSEDYLHMAAIIYELKDLQKLGRKLAEALR